LQIFADNYLHWHSQTNNKRIITNNDILYKAKAKPKQHLEKKLPSYYKN